MKNIIFNLKELFGYSNLAVNPDGQTTVKRRSKITYICCLFAFLTLGFGQAWADDPNTGHTINSPHFYYYNSADWANCMVLYGRGWDNANWTDGYNLDPVTGTKLYYAKIAVNWNNTYNQIAVLNAEKSGNNWKGEGNAIESRWSYATDHTDNVVWNYDLVSPKIFLWDGKSASSITWISDSESDYTKLNHSQTVEKWTSTDNGSTYSKSSTNSGTITISAYKMTGNGTASNTSNSATINTTSTTSASKDAAYTGEVTLTASANAGFTFVGWYDDSNTFISNTNPYTYNAPNSTKTIRARFKNETVHQVTVSYTCTSPSTTVKATETPYVGEVTASTFTAGTPVGFTFTSWTVGDGLTITSGSTSSNSISVTTKSSGSYTLTANYTEDLTTPWYIAGDAGTGLPFTGWGTSGTRMYKKSGHSTEEIYYCTITPTTTAVGTGFAFQAYNSGNTTYYGFNDRQFKIDQNSCTLYSGNPNNMRFLPYIIGDYEFELDNTGSDPVLTIHWPVINQVRISAASPADATNVGNFNLSDPVSNVRTVTRTLAANTTYTFKIVYDSEWYGKTSGALTRSTSTSSNTLTDLSTSGGDMTLTTDYAGSYTFKFNQSTKTLSVDFPEAYQITWGVGNVAGNKYAITCKKYGTNDAVISNSTWILKDNRVTFYAGNNEPENVVQTGYTWRGYYGDANGSTSQLSNQTGYSPTISTAGMSFYACFYENNYFITPYIVGQGTVDPAVGQNGHVATKVSFTATPGTGYKFDNWTQRSGTLTIESPNNVTTNVNATAASELQANFSPKYAVRVKTGGGAWSAESANHLTGYGAGQIGYVDITLNANTDYEIQVYDRETNTWYGGSTAQNIDYEHSGTTNIYTMATISTPTSAYLKSAAAGTYRFAWNLTGNKVTVEYPTSWFITSGQKTEGQDDNAGGSFTAEDDSSNDVKGGKFVANNASVIFTATPNTGYTFDGWYTNADCTTDKDATNPKTISSIKANKTIYAKFVPNTYTVTLTQTGAGSAGTPSVTASYNADAPSIATLPTPNDGYAFMGYYSATDGEGTQFVQANGTWNDVASYISGGKWIRDGGITLYAYFKKAEITALTLTPSVAAPGTTVTATPTIAPSPSGDIKLCWKILRSNGNLYTDDGFTDLSGNAVSFTAPAAGGTYKVVCVMHTGTSCDGGTELDTKEVDLVVASAHTVTIRYQDSNGRTLAPSREIEGRPLDWSEAINPPAITGYSFTRWDAGDGVIISTNKSAEVSTTTTATIYMKANYDGTLTAVYSKKNVIYFNNTLGWENVYVYFYNSNEYWSSIYGTGAQQSQQFNGDHKPYYEQEHGQMTRIEGTNIWYFDYTEAGYTTRLNVAFTKDDKHNTQWFYQTEAVRRGDHKSSLPMYVPLTTKYEIRNKHDESSTKYYTEGYWMNYPENTGYTLKIFDKVSGSPEPVVVQDIPFEFTADKTMPMSLTVELNANTTYGFKIYRNDGSWYGNNETMKINHSGDEGQTAWEFTTGTNNCGLKTSAAGDYTFTLKYDEKTAGSYYYLVGVHYPASVGSYRLVYTDNNTNLWSGNAKPSGWYHPSRVIYKNEGAADTVSFFVSKGKSPKIQIQKITTIDNEGNITWENVGDAVSYDDVSAAGVYNFITSQTADAISIEKVEPYTGNYYIRTGAVDGKWDNYRTGSDHLMTYSAFSEDRAQNTFGELFSHYKAKWCPRGTNVVFCIANDYSSSISDTLVQDVGDPYHNIYPANDGTRPGELKAESYSGTTITSSETGDKYSANIRFMWNRSTNKISRAYVSSSTNKTKKFLVLKGGAEYWNSNGSDLTGDGESHENKEAIFLDNENWIYEREIKVTTGTRFKLYACYAQDSPSETNAQYFRGAYDSGNIDSNTNSIILIGGDGTGTCNARLIYDFKTNRLIAAYLPDGSAVSGSTSIDADLMIIREHQGEGQQITFNTGGSLTEVKTVYGVMRFNRWILNNRQHPEDHDKEHSKTDELITQYHPLLAAGSQKSADERGLYWISFPFDVNLSEVFGFGTYGTHWIIMQYNGAERAKQGFWADSEGFWEYIWDRNGVVLKGGMGYVLALELDLMKATDRTFWSNEIQQVELFFPSTSTAGTIKQTTATVEVPAHECKIDRTGSGGTSTDINKNRTKVDSHWNIIGVPSYANYGTELTDEGGTVTWNDNTTLKWTNDLPFLYEWNANDNTYTVQSGSSYPFKAMHAYYVQYHGTLNWNLASATPASSIVARRTYAEAPLNEEFRLEIRRNDKMEDQTFVKLSNDEEVSANFVFGEDMTKEKNAGKANIYTIVENYLPVAGNTLPMSNQTTVVPVGVTIESAGDYTFAIPEGTDGIGVTLIDEETGIRTSLGALSYTVNLPKGNYDNRFVLEISPIKTITTGIDEVPSNQGPSTNARKVMIDGILYIVKDGKMYDARGTLVR